jgi:hypothetical protein
MSEENLDIKDILKRLDDLINVLKIISDDLAEISRALRVHVGSKIEETIPSSRPIIGQTQRLRTIDDVQRFFPQDLSGLLLFEVTEDYIIVKPKQYLGSENFARIASIVRDQLRGEYVSHGKESHFRIPRKI